MTALVALVISSILAGKHDPAKSTLYCSSDTSPSIITSLERDIHGLREVVKCFRVERGIFTEVLDSVSKANKGEKITYIDGFVLPGIIESHGHILQYGEMLESVSLYGAESVAEMRARIKDFLSAHEGEGYGTRDRWIRGVGWDQTLFGGVMPTAVCFQSITF
jgi:hypothetical protein